MYNKKVLIDALKSLGSAKAPSTKKDIIVDPNGQWAHPGEITRIPSNTITMQGVPYPVMAKPNVGQPQMMYPGQNYQFPDADYVDEFPMNEQPLAKKSMGGLTRFSGSAGRMMGLPPIMSTVGNAAPKIAATLPIMNQATKNLLTNPAIDSYLPIRFGTDTYLPAGLEQFHIDPEDYNILNEATQKLETDPNWRQEGLKDAYLSFNDASNKARGYGADLFKGLNYNFKDFSPSWQVGQDALHQAAGPQWMPSKEDFYTDKEVGNLVDQQIAYRNAWDQFEDMYPEEPGMNIMNALSGDTSREELFANLFPGVYMPNFRMKILSPEQSQWLNEAGLSNPTFVNKGMLNKYSLKGLTKGEDVLPNSYKRYLEVNDPNGFLYTADPKIVVGEMRGSLGLKLSDIQNATPEQLEFWRRKVIKQAREQALKQWENEMSTKISGSDAYNKLMNRPGARNKDGGAVRKEGGESPEGFISAKEGIDTPIYKQVSIKPSKIAGKGLFINEPVKAGEPIGISHIRKVFDRNGEAYQAPFPSTVLGYYNHSEEPNVREVDNGDHIVLIATRDIKPNEELTSNYDISGIQDLETSDNFKKGGSIPKLPKKKNARAYSRSLDATNRLLAEHPFFAQPKSRKNKIYDPNSQYFQDGGESEECTEDGRCEETDQIQNILDQGSNIPRKNVDVMWDVVEKSHPSADVYKSAKDIWTSKGVQPLSKRLGMYTPDITNVGNCMWAAGSGYQCLPETRGKIPLTPFESNDKFINAVNKGTTPFRRVAVTHDPNFALQETGMLQQGDIINFKGSGNSHAMTFSNYDEDGTPIFLDSNGRESDLGWNYDMWNSIRPNKEKVAYISRFNPEKFYATDIKALEEKARTNPTYYQDGGELDTYPRGGGLGKGKGKGKGKESTKFKPKGNVAPFVTSDPEEYAYRQAAYDDSSHVANKYNSIMPKPQSRATYYYPFSNIPYLTINPRKTRTTIEKDKSVGIDLLNQGAKSTAWDDFMYNQIMEDKKLYPDVVNQPTAWETKSNYFPRGINLPFIGDTEEGTWYSDTRPRYQPPRQKIIFQEPPKPPKPPVKESKVIQQKPVVKPEVIQPTPTPQPIPTPTPIIVNPELQKFVEERRPEPPGPPPGIGTDVMPVYDIDELPMYATPDPDAEIVTDTKRYIDWNGNSVGYRLPRFKQPGHGGPLIKAGKKHYFHYPSIETRNQIQIIPEEEYKKGGEYLELDLTPEEIQEYAKGGYIIEDISVPELTKANLGKIVKTTGKALSKAPGESGWVRGTTTILPRVEPTKLFLGNVPEDFASNINFPLSIYNKDQSGYLTLNQIPRQDNTFSLFANMPNTMDAGRAFQLMNQALTKPNPSILEPFSLSLDSYNMLLNMGKKSDWQLSYENHIPLNYMSVHSNLFEGLDIPKGKFTARPIKQETADQMVKRLNDMLLQKGITEQARVFSIPGGPLKEIQLPNYRVTRQYAEGGYLPQASMGLIVPKAGQLARTGIYKGVNPAGYGILDKVKGVPSELFNTAVNNSTRPFRVGMSLKYGHPEMLETFLKTKRVPLEDFKKMSDGNKMQLFDSSTLKNIEDIGRRRLDAWAVGLGLPQEYSTLEQIGDDKFRMLNTEYTPEYFNELYNDLRASGYENTLTAGYNPLEGLSREFYRTKLQNRLATQKDIDAEMTLQDQMRTFGWNAWDRSRNAKLNPASFSGIDTGSVWDNDPYGVMGGFRWDIDQHPQGLQFTTSDVWDLNPFEKRGSAFLNPSDLSKKSLAASYFKPLQNLEALKLVGGKPFLIENNFVIDPKTYNTLDKWEDGGNMDYTLGDEVDEATMKELKKLGYTFEKI